MRTCDQCHYTPIRLMSSQDLVECRGDSVSIVTLCSKHPDVTDRFTKKKLSIDEWKDKNMKGTHLCIDPFGKQPISAFLLRFAEQVWIAAQENK